MKKLKMIMNMFAAITTCVLFATALFTTVFFPLPEVSPSLLWQILVTSFLCAVSTLVHQGEQKPTGLIIFLHYLLINAIVLGSGYFFEWYDVKKMSSVIAMVVLIAVMYVVVAFIFWKKGVKDAEQMNRKLKEYQNHK